MNQLKQFACADAALTISPDGLSLQTLALAGCKNSFKGDKDIPLWRIWLFDEKTKRTNDYPLIPDRAQYWQSPWQMGDCSVSSLDSTLDGYEWEPDSGLLTLNYIHPDVDVRMYFKLQANSITWWADFTNKGQFPVYQIDTIPGWRVQYQEADSFLIPEHTMSAIEYRPVYKTEYTMHSTWDGFLITSPGKVWSLYAIQEPDCLLPTHTRLDGNKEKNGHVAINCGTICFRESGRSFTTVKNKISVFKDLRTWGDAYIHDNFDELPALNDKIAPELYDKIAAAVLIPLAGNITEAKNIVQEIPSPAIIHTPGYMHPTKHSPISWDSFPNYFPPNAAYGTAGDFAELITAVRDSGHVFMPRNSFFYWSKGSDVDNEFGLEKMAKVRIDGKPRTANWCLPGYIVSPSCKMVQELLEQFYEKWHGLGAEMYFTNVIGAINIYGNRYDFHPDGPGPDLFFDQIRKMMKKYGALKPMLSEAGAAWQLPYQTGFCLHPAWNPDEPGEHYWRTPDRGKYIRYRNDPGVFLKNEYIRFYPHNTGSRLGQNTIPQLTFSLLHSLNPKLGIVSKDRFTVRHKRWLNLLSHLGKTAFKTLFGARLLKYDISRNNVITAEYENCTVIGNCSNEALDCGGYLPASTIAPGGFLFLAEGLAIGALEMIAGKKLDNGQILFLENGEQKLYDTAPVDTGQPPNCNKEFNNPDKSIDFTLRFDSLPEYGNTKGFVELIKPPASTGKNSFEIRYNMHYGSIQFIQKYPGMLICDLTSYDMELISGKLYHISIIPGDNPALVVNGKSYDQPKWYYVHEQVPLTQPPKVLDQWDFKPVDDNWQPNPALDITLKSLI